MKKYFKSDYEKQKRKSGLKHFYFLALSVLILIPLMTNGQNCYCDESGAITIGSDVGVETVSEAIFLGKLDPNPSPFSPVQNVCIKGDLSVDMNYNFYNLKVNMYTGANIFVEFYTELRMGGLTELYGCSTMWNSVTVKSFATLKLRNVTIRDGEVAVDAKALSNLFISGNEFFNNYIGLKVSSKNNGSVSFVNQIGSMNSNTFRTLTYGGLLPPHSGENGYAGVQIDNIGGFSIGSLTTGSNAFILLDNGIVANNSSFAVHRSGLFTSLASPVPTTQFPNPTKGNGIVMTNSSAVVTLCNFDRNTVGVHAIESSVEVTDCFFPETIATGVRVINTSNGTVNIKNNPIMTCFYNAIELINLNQTNVNIENNVIRMIEENPPSAPTNRDAFAGIDLQNCHFDDNNGCLITGNTINLEDAFNGIRLVACEGVRVISNHDININDVSFNFFNLEEVVGIKVDGGGKNKISDNDIDGPGGSISMGGAGSVVAGIRSESSANNTYCSNTFRNTQFGQRFDGPNGGTFYQNNTFNLHSTALHMDSDGVIGEKKDAGNRWKFTSVDVGARHENSDPFFSENSQFIIPNSSYGIPNSPVYPTGIDPQPDPVLGPHWFLDQGGTSVVCDPSLAPSGGEANTLDFTIAGGNVNSGTPYSNTTNWELKRYLFDKLAHSPSLTQQYPSLALFYNSNVNSSLGKLHQIGDYITNLVGTPANEVQLYQENLDSLQVRLWELVVNDSLLALANPIDSALLVAERQAITAEMAGWENENDSLLLLIQSYRTGLAQQYLAQNAAILTTAIYEANEKTVNNIYLNTVAQGIYSLTQQQLADLDAIAWQCPKMGGNAVFRARSLYSMEIDTINNDQTNCSPPPQQQIGNTGQAQHQLIQTGSFTLYPNPVADLATLILADNIPVDRIKLVDLNGQVVAEYPIATGTNRFSFSTSLLPQGMYFMELKEKGRTVHNEKLFIAR